MTIWQQSPARLRYDFDILWYINGDWKTKEGVPHSFSQLRCLHKVKKYNNLTKIQNFVSEIQMSRISSSEVGEKHIGERGSKILYSFLGWTISEIEIFDSNANLLYTLERDQVGFRFFPHHSLGFIGLFLFRILKNIGQLNFLVFAHIQIVSLDLGLSVHLHQHQQPSWLGR